MRIAIAEIISSLKKIEEGAKGTIIGELVNGAVNRAERMESACTAGYDTCAIPEGWVKGYPMKDPVPWWMKSFDFILAGVGLLLAMIAYSVLRMGIINNPNPQLVTSVMVCLIIIAVVFFVVPTIVSARKRRIYDKYGVIYNHKFLKNSLPPVIGHDIQTIKEEGIFEEIYIVGPKAFFKTGHGIAVIIGEAGDQPFLIREISL
ncbi:MAG: hypothetical protein AAB451_02040 [Patescibacteria group bacterium]